MGQPKKQSSPRKTGLRRSHLRLELARRVNAKSPVKVRTTRRETGKALAKNATVADVAPVKKTEAKKSDLTLAS
jgi:hypothetical protein